MQVQHLGFEEVNNFYVMIVLSVEMFAVGLTIQNVWANRINI